jgi:hypothetical protein
VIELHQFAGPGRQPIAAAIGLTARFLFDGPSIPTHFTDFRFFTFF